MADFRPTDVVLTAPLPLAGTLGRMELEQAAALVIWTLCRNGNVWRPVWHDEIEACLRVDVLSDVEPVRSWCRNPFFRPDPAGLRARRFAIATSHTVELTELALRPIKQRWTQKAGA